jgi:Predicted metal-dependent hydrolase of the TIM-barrel fold
MRFRISIIILLTVIISTETQEQIKTSLNPGYEQRIKDYIDTLKIFDTHEHMFNPEMLKSTNFLDFSLLLQQNSYDGLISAGMPDSTLRQLFFEPLTPKEKWKIIEPYWNNSFNTTPDRILLLAIKNLYGIDDLNESTVETLSLKIKKAYEGDWFNHVLKDLCRIDYIIEDGDNVGDKYDFIRYAKRFNSWLTLRTKYRIDSLAVMEVEPIYTLEDYVRSLRTAFENALKQGMVAIKINVSYKRTLSFDNVTTEAARKVFHSLVNGNEDFTLSLQEAKPLQDYMLHQLLNLAEKYKIPVAFHTGLQAGGGNIIDNSDPRLLVNLFFQYPDINFVLFHGSYPFGGELTTLARNFKNVYIDMNWTYAISPAYADRYLGEWLEAVPASKIMAFGGDQRCVENTYGNLIIAKQIISDVLTDKVRNGYLSESEAKTIARMILHDNGVKFYNLK